MMGAMKALGFAALVAASVLGLFLKWLFGGAPIYALVIGGVSFLISGVLVLRVAEPEARVKQQLAS